jgi:hypothetical protein
MQSSVKLTLWFVMLGFTPVGLTGASEAPPLEIGYDKQLFLDDYIIESLDNVSRKLNQATKYEGNPVLTAAPKGDPSWEAGGRVGFSSVLFDEEDRIFKMWYGLYVPTAQDDMEGVMAYATSRDGIHWQKPSLGLVERDGSRDNNVLRACEGGQNAVFKDLHESDPEKRYKMLFLRGGAVCAAHSADGLQWTDYNEGEEVIFHPPGHDSQPVAYWDEGLGKYVAIIRDRLGKIKEVREGLVTDPEARQGWRQLWGGEGMKRSPENHSIRRVGQAESDDFVHWTPMRTVVGPDAHDPLNVDQFYNMEVIPYGPLRIGLMTVFSYDPVFCRGTPQLTYSWDGMNWHRGGNREVFIPLGQNPGDFDWGSIYPAQGPIVVGDEIWIYYIGAGFSHNYEWIEMPPAAQGVPSSIGLARLRLDGFVSLNAGTGEGVLTTKPLIFRGDRLVLNADGSRGHVLVEILDTQGKPIPGYGKQDCDAFRADEIRHPVTWKGKTNLKALGGKAIKLRFYLERAKLYSFSFRN